MFGLNTALKTTAACTAAAIGLSLSPQAHSTDYKFFNAAAVCAPYTSSTPDYAHLRFRAEGVINDSGASKFVICNLPRDSESAWNFETMGTYAFFRRTTAGTPAITSNQCTMTIGFNLTEPLQSKTYSAAPYPGSSTYGFATMLGDIPSGDDLSYGTIVCRIAPGSLMDLIVVLEGEPTDTSPAP